MSRELFWLTLTAIMTGLMWTPYIVDRIMVRGLMGAMDNPTPNAKPHSPWAWRQMHAHDNALENLVILSTISREDARSPLVSLGSTARRNNGASVVFVVKAQTVTEAVASNRSSCKITTGRDLPA